MSRIESTIDLDALGLRFEAACDMFCDTASKQFQAYAQENAPWTDRTGDARRRLYGDWNRTSTGREIRISHGVNYGFWLEFAHEQNYAILGPTVEHLSANVMRGWESLIEKVQIGLVYNMH